jgi:hypothetical protein
MPKWPQNFVGGKQPIAVEILHQATNLETLIGEGLIVECQLCYHLFISSHFDMVCGSMALSWIERYFKLCYMDFTCWEGDCSGEEDD